ncbi:MAG: YicC family protein [Lachnospiraceae bacterium]|nr:YicC family protein [Lachnospiraceae bacterium]
MISSMTGFGRGERITAEKRILIEMKAVNHRFLDLNIKLPKRLNFLEGEIRNYLKDNLARGKVDVFITYEDFSGKDAKVVYNHELAAEYIGYLKSMKEEFGLSCDIDVAAVGRYADIFNIEDKGVDEESCWAEIKIPLEEACESFVKSREIEGEKLKADLISKLDSMSRMVDFIEERSPQIVEDYKKRLTDRIEELTNGVDIDPQRIATEVTIFADKVCVDEEIVRLKSHIAGTKDILLAGGAVGRKLDFMVQEMNREANTILSKSNTLSVSNKGIDLKTEIEKIREQIQNIE